MTRVRSPRPQRRAAPRGTATAAATSSDLRHGRNLNEGPLPEERRLNRFEPRSRSRSPRTSTKGRSQRNGDPIPDPATTDPVFEPQRRAAPRGTATLGGGRHVLAGLRGTSTKGRSQRNGDRACCTGDRPLVPSPQRRAAPRGTATVHVPGSMPSVTRRPQRRAAPRGTATAWPPRQRRAWQPHLNEGPLPEERRPRVGRAGVHRGVHLNEGPLPEERRPKPGAAQTETRSRTSTKGRSQRNGDRVERQVRGTRTTPTSTKGRSQRNGDLGTGRHADHPRSTATKGRSQRNGDPSSPSPSADVPGTSTKGRSQRNGDLWCDGDGKYVASPPQRRAAPRGTATAVDPSVRPADTHLNEGPLPEERRPKSRRMARKLESSPQRRAAPRGTATCARRATHRRDDGQTSTKGRSQRNGDGTRRPAGGLTMAEPQRRAAPRGTATLGRLRPG